MHVAGNAGQSSSVLPMLQSHRDALPSANYVGTEEVTICRLDSVAPEILLPDDVALLKIDVQGFEKQVIAGGAVTVRDQCIGLELELSFEPLYDGGMLVRRRWNSCVLWDSRWPGSRPSSSMSGRVACFRPTASSSGWLALCRPAGTRPCKTRYFRGPKSRNGSEKLVHLSPVR